MKKRQKVGVMDELGSLLIGLAIAGMVTDIQYKVRNHVPLKSILFVLASLVLTIGAFVVARVSIANRK